MDSNYIFINGFKVMVYLGVTDQERSEAQEVKISLKIFSDLEPSAESDNIMDSIDYESVYISIKNMTLTHKWNLVETMARDIVNKIKTDYKADKVNIKIEKFVLDGVESVGVYMS
jgi:dihydroneopterin aldolase